jgi:hypothetical protein
MMLADPTVVQAWVTGWALSRGTPSPVPVVDGWWVDVALPEQRGRYVLSTLHPSRLRVLASSLAEPWTFIKVCASADRVAPSLPANWTVQPPIFMMTTVLTGGSAKAISSQYTPTLSGAGAVMAAHLKDQRCRGRNFRVNRAPLPQDRSKLRDCYRSPEHPANVCEEVRGDLQLMRFQ